MNMVEVMKIARFIVEIIKKIRERIGNEYIILLKINSEDDDPNGITPEGFITACKMAEKQELI